MLAAAIAASMADSQPAPAPDPEPTAAPEPTPEAAPAPAGRLPPLTAPPGAGPAPAAPNLIDF